MAGATTPIIPITGDIHVTNDSLTKATARLESTSLDDPYSPDPNYVHKPLPNPITNFPLPRGLRDEILGWVLDANRVKHVVGKTGMFIPNADTSSVKLSTPTTVFEFHTGILAANKTISSEALKCMYGRNPFVRVTYDMPLFRMVCCWLADLPFVQLSTGAHTDSIPVRLSVNIDWPGATFASCFSRDGSSATEQGTSIILLEDLPRLWTALRYLCGQSIPRAAALVTSDREQRLALHRVPKTTLLSLRVAGQDNSYHTLTSAEQANILSQLQHLVGAGYDMVLTGLGGKEAEAAVQAATGPLLVWPSAFLSQGIADIEHFVKRAAKLAQEGYLFSSFQHFSTLLRFLHTNGILQAISKGMKPDNMCAVTFIRRVYVLEFDLRCAVFDLQLRMKQYDIAECLANDLSEGLQQASHRQVRMASHLLFLLNLLCHEPLMTDTVTEGIWALENYGAEERGTQMQNDIRVARTLKSASDGQEVVAAEAREVLKELSIFTIPFRVYQADWDKELPLEIAKDDLAGWQDKYHFANLTQPEKEFVQTFQKKRGLPVSRFD